MCALIFNPSCTTNHTAIPQNRKLHKNSSITCHTEFQVVILTSLNHIMVDIAESAPSYVSSTLCHSFLWPQPLIIKAHPSSFLADSPYSPLICTAPVSRTASNSLLLCIRSSQLMRGGMDVGHDDTQSATTKSQPPSPGLRAWLRLWKPQAEP